MGASGAADTSSDSGRRGSDASSGLEEPISRRKARQMNLNRQKRVDKGDDTTQAAPEQGTLAASSSGTTLQPEGDAMPMEGDSFRHDAQPAMVAAVPVDYCAQCGFPRDFCDFGPCWDKCKAAALAERPQFYKHHLTAHPEDAPKEDAPVATAPVAAAPVAAAPPAAPKQKPKKKEVPKQVTVQRVSRAKHKVATIIVGLDLFDVKLEAAAKIFKKRFACGCSAVKGLPGQSNHVELQGDFETDVDQVILDNFSQIRESDIMHLNPK